MNNSYKLLKVKKINVDNNYLILFRHLNINLNKGEVYFSFFKNLKEKNWKNNSKITQNFYAVKGKFRFLILNKIKQKKSIVTISHQNNNILKIYPNNWYKIKPLKKNSILLNQVNLKKNKYKKYEKLFKIL